MTMASFEKRLEAILARLPRPKEPMIPVELQWLSHVACSELDEMERIAAGAVADGREEFTDAEQLRFIEIHAAALRRQAEGWSDACGADRARYDAIDQAAQPVWPEGDT
jgi:uncharacterized Zn finger protein